MESDQQKLLRELKALNATPPKPLDEGATAAQDQAHSLYTDACSHVANAIDALERSLAGKK